MQGLGSGVAFVLASKLLHPRSKAMGVDLSTVELMLYTRDLSLQLRWAILRSFNQINLVSSTYLMQRLI